MTGIELAIGKAAITGVAKVAGIGAPTVVNAWNRAATRRAVHAGGRPRTQGFEVDLDDAATAAAVSSHFASGEVDALAVSIASALLLRECGRNPDARLRDLKNQFTIAVRLRGGSSDSSALCERVFDSIVGAVAREIATLKDLDKSGLPPEVRSVVLRCAAETGAATARNVTLLEDLSEITGIDNFRRELRGQISALHRTMRLPHAGTSRQVTYERLFVAPRLERGLAPVSKFVIDDESLSLTQHCEEALRLLVVGDPGGGKSTLALKHTFDLASSTEGPARVPFLVILRDYAPHLLNNKTSLVRYLEMMCEAPYGVPAPPGAVEYLLLNGLAVVIFDGLDELLQTSQRRDVVTAVEGFAFRYPTTQLIVTTRRVGYEEAPLDSELFGAARLLEFNDDQVEAYARKWFSLDDSHAREQQAALTATFLQDSAFVRDLRVNPLMLSLMCGIYATEHYIPRNRPDVYEKCALLLFERWDKQRGIDAPLAFDAHVQSALRALALWLYPQQESQSGLPKADLVEFITDYLHRKRFDDEDEARNAATQFIEFCKGRAWVLTDVGADLYGFTHRTFLEYFTASQLVKSAPSAKGLYEFLHERILAQEWDVVAQLAVQILGRTVEDGADDFLELIVSPDEGSGVVDENSASFAGRALAFIVPRPPVLRSIVEACIAASTVVLPSQRIPSPQRGAVLPVSELLIASAENLPLVGKYLYETCAGHIANRERPEAHLKILWFTPSFANTASLTSRAVPRYWAETEPSRRNALLPLMRANAAELPWVAVELACAGELSVRELIAQHGMKSLYLNTPLWSRRFRVARALQVIRYLHADKQTVLEDQFVAQLHAELLRERDVWITLSHDDQDDRHDLQLLRYVINPEDETVRVSDPIKWGVLLALCLPMVEFSINNGPKTKFFAEVALLDKLRRKSKISVKEVTTELEKLPVATEMRALLADWALRSFSTLENRREKPHKKSLSNRQILRDLP